MLITIEHRHTIGTNYYSKHNCPLARALRERLPGAEVLVGGLTVEIDGRVYEISPSFMWDQLMFRLVQKGSLHSVTLTIEGYHPTFVSVAQEAAERLADKRVNN